MKKSLLVIALFAGFTFAASAQVPACTVDTTHFSSSTHVYPASLPCITTGQLFAGTVTLKVPDTLDAGNFVPAAAGIEAYIDSIQISTIAGMPAGIVTGSSPSLGTWLPKDAYSCTQFSGTVNGSTTADGTYNLTITGTGCGHFIYSGQTYSRCIPNFSFSRVYPYSLQVCYPAGITEVSEGMSLSIYPNPNQGAFTVTIAAADRITGSMMILDQLGRTIRTQPVDVTGTQQIALELGHVAAGSYLLVLNTSNGKSVKQFIVK